ncbi:Gfo/Idh/MocA family oxidoreductase [Asanoa sp. WMMD1127]|uniref:Gfo/Idh/MocA family protein n=1 Tax=Asanoa sp. WMMD1127 TaxID=3016107 RepID=UPI0024179743|nr:Gfo/Idh/MocA family oxidoreductase [Asanoa sp. WMMD1127]MDG4820484.1 Gfo/Idh/MocA family oxidoreductase [Asanoa sp. WMMD1127]
MRAVLVGAGAMGAEWLAAIAASPDVLLAAVVDLDEAAAARAAAGAVPSATSLTAVAAGADFVVDATVPAAHFAVTTEALRLGLPVLGEKPLAATLPEALTLAALSSLTGTPFVISQSRRYERSLADFKTEVDALGTVGALHTSFYRAPHFGGFRETMPHPLLLDMAIHPFDTARYLLSDEPVSVFCDAWNPPWSWYAGAASANALFRFASGARYSYTASWCAAGQETSWNGSWRAVAEGGTAVWDGEGAPSSTLLETIGASLASFVEALGAGTRPATSVHRNVLSLAMVLCAVESADSGRVVVIDETLSRAHADAVAAAPPDVAEVLRSWPSVRGALLES